MARFIEVPIVLTLDDPEEREKLENLYLEYDPEERPSYKCLSMDAITAWYPTGPSVEEVTLTRVEYGGDQEFLVYMPYDAFTKEMQERGFSIDRIGDHPETEETLIFN